MLERMIFWYDINIRVFYNYISFLGTTADPKGVQRPVGHAATLCWSMHAVYGLKRGVWWAASDLGWVVGHSYICYGPLLAGLTSVLYEGKPDRTPDPGQYFR